MKAIAAHPDIPGLHCVPRFLNKAEQQDLLACIERSPWNTAMARRVQHYGYRYNYRARNVTSDDYLGPYPGWLQGLAEKLAPDGSHAYFNKLPEQIIINEYTRSQGIGRHVDAPIFGPTVATLPLLEAWSMTFRPVTNPAKHTDITTYPGDLYLFEDTGTISIHPRDTTYCHRPCKTHGAQPPHLNHLSNPQKKRPDP